MDSRNIVENLNVTEEWFDSGNKNPNYEVDFKEFTELSVDYEEPLQAFFQLILYDEVVVMLQIFLHRIPGLLGIILGSSMAIIKAIILWTICNRCYHYTSRGSKMLQLAKHLNVGDDYLAKSIKVSQYILLVILLSVSGILTAIGWYKHLLNNKSSIPTIFSYEMERNANFRKASYYLMVNMFLPVPLCLGIIATGLFGKIDNYIINLFTS